MKKGEGPFGLTGKRLWVAGHRRMVGSAIVRHLAAKSCEVITASRDELDLTDQRTMLDRSRNTRC